jgi:ATP-dependent DNA helicase RecG
MIEEKPDINASTLALQLGLSLRTTQRYLKKLCEQQEIEFRGAPKTGGYWKIDAKSQTKQ